MMTIETYLKEVGGKGIGLFTKSDIKSGDILYRDDEIFSKTISNDIFKTLDKLQQDFLNTYATYKKDNNYWYICLDNAKFWNHSKIPNTKYYKDEFEGYCYALIDIPADTELTSDYTEFCDICKYGDFGFEIV